MDSPAEKIKDELLDPDSDFAFETESLPLKGNKDYLKLLRTLCILESQRTQTLKVSQMINNNLYSS